jgi:hypothetical protein
MDVSVAGTALWGRREDVDGDAGVRVGGEAVPLAVGRGLFRPPYLRGMRP